ncbi:hypothetical protein DL765_001789 [Monosporascus sp. GIB2]|nr:hypothetical protein DL765_001789 [Monosporascus sp. GIB2]
MKLLTLLTAPIAVASVILQGRQDAQELQVIRQFHKPTSKTCVTIWDSSLSYIYASTCSDSVESGSFRAFPFAFSVDENGRGNITVGVQSYPVADDTTNTQPVTCGRMHSDTESLITCTVFWPRSTTLRQAPSSGPDVASCLPNGDTELFHMVTNLKKGDFMQLANIADESNITESNMSEAPQPPVVDVGGPPCPIYHLTRLLDNGNPHQNPLHIQLSDVMECGQRSCGIERFESVSFTIGFSASATIAQWISGGFAVEKSIQTGNAYSCDGDPGDVFAVWRRQAQTAYTVRNFKMDCGRTSYGNPFVMWSPNSNNRGGAYYCVYGRKYVRALGDRWLDLKGRAGGP